MAWKSRSRRQRAPQRPLLVSRHWPGLSGCSFIRFIWEERILLEIIQVIIGTSSSPVDRGRFLGQAVAKFSSCSRTLDCRMEASSSDIPRLCDSFSLRGRLLSLACNVCLVVFCSNSTSCKNPIIICFCLPCVISINHDNQCNRQPLLCSGISNSSFDSDELLCFLSEIERFLRLERLLIFCCELLNFVLWNQQYTRLQFFKYISDYFASKRCFFSSSFSS